MTAEFVLDGVSELTRSIFVYLGKPLNLTDDVCPALIGAVLKEFADWFADNYDHAIELLHKIADSPNIPINLRADGADEFTELLTRERQILPRALRIDVQTLHDNAEKYDLFEQQAHE